MIVLNAQMAYIYRIDIVDMYAHQENIQTLQQVNANPVILNAVFAMEILRIIVLSVKALMY